MLSPYFGLNFRLSNKQVPRPHCPHSFVVVVLVVVVVTFVIVLVVVVIVVVNGDGGGGNGHFFISRILSF